jgi:phosphoglycerate dehydrogenase-like enzyme
MTTPFRVGVTRDFLKPDGTLGFPDIGVDLLDQADGVEWEYLAQNTPELSSEQVCGYDALLVLAPKVTAATLAGGERLKVIARFGVGYDSVDVDACSKNGVLLTITPDGIRRPMASTVLAFLLALSHKMLIKHRLTRAGRWHSRMDHMGQGVTGKTLGVIGVGNIGRDVFHLAAPFGMRHLGYDPHVASEDVESQGIAMVDLETLLSESDYVAICCSLRPETHHLINAERIALMKETAYVISVARGPIVDQKALTAALAEERIQGAALDVFEKEPVEPDDPILDLENVILAPHSLCWTDEAFSGMGRDACGSILDVAAGRTPKNVVNRQILTQSQLRATSQ